MAGRAVCNESTRLRRVAPLGGAGLIRRAPGLQLPAIRLEGVEPGVCASNGPAQQVELLDYEGGILRVGREQRAEVALEALHLLGEGEQGSPLPVDAAFQLRQGGRESLCLTPTLH